MEKRYILGLDVSLSSPGYALYDRQTEQWALACHAQRKRETLLLDPHPILTDSRFSQLTTTTSLTVLPLLPPSATSKDTARYLAIITNLEKFINHVVDDKKNVHVVIENYAFVQPKFSGNGYKLKEITGIIKYTLRDIQMSTITVSAWKKTVCGNGRASKADVVKKIITNGPTVDLCLIFGLTPQADGNVPCPVQDLADASAIVMSQLVSVKRKTTQKKKKAKKQKICK